MSQKTKQLRTEKSQAMSKSPTAKTVQKSSKKLTKTLNEIKGGKSKLFTLSNPEDGLETQLKKFHQVLETESKASEFSLETIQTVVDLWSSAIDFVLRNPQHQFLNGVLNLILKLFELPQIQPMVLADFPAPDEVDANTEKVLDSFFTNMVRTVLYIFFTLNHSELIIEQAKRKGPFVPTTTSTQQKALKQYQNLPGLAPESSDLMAHLLADISFKMPIIFDAILQRVDLCLNQDVTKKDGRIISDEVLLDFPSLKKWDSYINFIAGKHTHTKQLYETIQYVELNWLIHFELHTPFVLSYYKYWTELVPKDDVPKFPGFELFKMDIFRLVSIKLKEEAPLTQEMAAVLVCFGVLHKDTLQAFLEKMKEKEDILGDTGKKSLFGFYHLIFDELKSRKIIPTKYLDLSKTGCAAII